MTYERHACSVSACEILALPPTSLHDACLEQPTKWAAPHQVVAALAAPALGLCPFHFGFCGLATASCAFSLSVSHLGFVLLFWVATMAAFSSSSPS